MFHVMMRIFVLIYFICDFVDNSAVITRCQTSPIGGTSGYRGSGGTRLCKVHTISTSKIAGGSDNESTFDDLDDDEYLDGENAKDKDPEEESSMNTTEKNTEVTFDDIYDDEYLDEEQNNGKNTKDPEEESDMNTTEKNIIE